MTSITGLKTKREGKVVMPAGAMLPHSKHGFTNMKKFFLTVIVALLLTAICLACIFTILFTNINKQRFSNPTEAFSQKELFGGWEARYGDALDSITISEDGFFEQEYKRTNNYSFLSDKNKWNLENFPDGRIRLHLIGARYYHAGVSFFDYNATNLILYDPFSKSVANLNNELILTLVYKSSGQLVLYQMLIGPDEGFPIFDTDSQYFQKINDDPGAK